MHGYAEDKPLLIKRLRNTVGKDAPLAAHIVRGWIDESN